MLDKVNCMESIFTIGGFNELIDKVLMPSLVINFDPTLGKLKLEAWPLTIDTVCGFGHLFLAMESEHWLYHMYDNNFNLLSKVDYTSCDESDDSKNSDEHQEAEDSKVEYYSTEVTFDYCGFNTFFTASDLTSANIYERHLTINEEAQNSVAEFKEEEEVVEDYYKLFRNVMEEINGKKRTVRNKSCICELDEEEEEVHVHDNQKQIHEILRVLICQVVDAIGEMYQSLNIKIKSDEYYETCRFSRILGDCTRFVVFLVKDYPADERVVVSMTFVHLSEDYRTVLQKLPLANQEMSYEDLEVSYFLSMGSLEWVDKLVVFKMLVDGYYCKLSLESMLLEKAESYNIQHIAPTTVHSSSMYVIKDDGFVSVARLRLLAQNGTPLGLSVSLFNLEGCNEIPILFLVVHPSKL